MELARAAGFEVDDSQSAVPDPAALDAADALEREMLQYLPLAKTELALRALLAQPGAWRRLSKGGADLATLRTISSGRALHWLLHPPTVAIVGAANVGKSTIANRLFGQERAITADLPGTTRDWVGETANLDGLAVTLVDTPGIRSTDDPIEREAIGRARGEVADADLVILVLDASRPLEPDQAHLLEEHPSALLVVNKVDRHAAWDTSAMETIRTVGTTGVGIDEVRRAVQRRFGCDAIDPARPRWWTARQRDVIERATDQESLERLWDAEIKSPAAQ